MNILVGVLSMLLFAMPCSVAVGAQQHGEPAPGAKHTSAADLKAMIESNAGVMIVDVRDPEEFRKDTIPGAINIPLGRLEARLKDMPKDTLLVFVCTGGSRSSRAAKLAENAGFRSSTFCPIREWKERGFKTVAGEGGPSQNSPPRE